MMIKQPLRVQMDEIIPACVRLRVYELQMVPGGGNTDDFPNASKQHDTAQRCVTSGAACFVSTDTHVLPDKSLWHLACPVQGQIAIRIASRDMIGSRADVSVSDAGWRILYN